MDWKKILISASMVIVVWMFGFVAGREQHFRDATKMLQSDTTYVYDTVRYSRLELTTNSYRLDIPKTGGAELVFVPSDSVNIIYRDSVRYVTLPREYFFTRTKDAEIWHSGIDSRIDSLNVFSKSATIRETAWIQKKHSFSLGLEASYAGAFRMPLQAEYEYYMTPNIASYGYLEYELFTKQFGAGIGIHLILDW